MGSLYYPALNPAPTPATGLDLRSLTPAELRARVQAHTAPAYRAEQVFRWLHGPELDEATGLPRSLRDKSNVPKELREALLAEAPLRPLTVEQLQEAKDGTRKFRFRTHDGRAIESVLIPDDDEERAMLTLCISSQVGCALDCQFCATATLGFTRHLSAGEIVEQVAQATAVAGRRPTNIVFMGMGEPLHNVANVKRAFELLLHPWGAGFSPRRITVSTVGLVSGIEELAQLSPAPRWRPKPSVAVAQKRQSIAQPTWDEMQRVSLFRAASSSGISTDSIARPSWVRKRSLRVPSCALWTNSWASGVSRWSCSSAARSAGGTLVMASSDSMPWPCSQRKICSAR